MSGELAYFTIEVSDTDRAQKFYHEILGWEFASGNVPDAYFISNSTPPGGLHAGENGKAPEAYFRVDDIQESIAKVRELGGKAEDAKETSTGFFSQAQDDQGTPFHLFQFSQHKDGS
jgi:predicted enzyme related to lactoylglutathione lyase